MLAAYDRVGVGGTLGSWGWDVDGMPWSGGVDEVLDRQRAVADLTDGHPRVHGWVTLVGHDLILYINSVSHTFDYVQGFSTTVQAMAPMSVSRSPKTGSNPDGTIRAPDAGMPTPSGAG